MAATISLYFATTGATGGVTALRTLKSTVIRQEAIGQINGDPMAAEKTSSENPIVLSLIVAGSYRGRKVSHCDGNLLPNLSGVAASGKSLECYGAISPFAMSC
ncbi:UNVERIFIED_CONTAM: hypothetical protein K2H54_005396 [Gekko kuhli]